MHDQQQSRKSLKTRKSVHVIKREPDRNAPPDCAFMYDTLLADGSWHRSFRRANGSFCKGSTGPGSGRPAKIELMPLDRALDEGQVMRAQLIRMKRDGRMLEIDRIRGQIVVGANGETVHLLETADYWRKQYLAAEAALEGRVPLVEAPPVPNYTRDDIIDYGRSGFMGTLAQWLQAGKPGSEMAELREQVEGLKCSNRKLSAALDRKRIDAELSVRALKARVVALQAEVERWRAKALEAMSAAIQLADVAGTHQTVVGPSNEPLDGGLRAEDIC